MELAEWLLDRIAEDEEDADRWHESDCASCMGPPGPFHCTCNGAARVLAECEAKRAIVEDHALEPTSAGGGRGCGRCVGYYSWGPEVVDGPCPTLRALALPYASHPDYRDEWRP